MIDAELANLLEWYERHPKAVFVVKNLAILPQAECVVTPKDSYSFLGMRIVESPYIPDGMIVGMVPNGGKAELGPEENYSEVKT